MEENVVVELLRYQLYKVVSVERGLFVEFNLNVAHCGLNLEYGLLCRNNCKSIRRLLRCRSCLLLCAFGSLFVAAVTSGKH